MSFQCLLAEHCHGSGTAQAILAADTDQCEVGLQQLALEPA